MCPQCGARATKRELENNGGICGCCNHHAHVQPHLAMISRNQAALSPGNRIGEGMTLKRIQNQFVENARMNNTRGTTLARADEFKKLAWAKIQRLEAQIARATDAAKFDRALKV